MNSTSAGRLSFRLRRDLRIAVSSVFRIKPIHRADDRDHDNHRQSEPRCASRGAGPVRGFAAISQLRTRHDIKITDMRNWFQTARWCVVKITLWRSRAARPQCLCSLIWRDSVDYASVSRVPPKTWGRIKFRPNFCLSIIPAPRGRVSLRLSSTECPLLALSLHC
jgi:hypothetical protein